MRDKIPFIDRRLLSLTVETNQGLKKVKGGRLHYELSVSDPKFLKDDTIRVIVKGDVKATKGEEENPTPSDATAAPALATVCARMELVFSSSQLSEKEKTPSKRLKEYIDAYASNICGEIIGTVLGYTALQVTRFPR